MEREARDGLKEIAKLAFRWREKIAELAFRWRENITKFVWLYWLYGF